MKKLTLALALAFTSTAVLSIGVEYQEGVDTVVVTSCIPPTERTDGTPITLEELASTEVVFSQEDLFSSTVHIVPVPDIYCNTTYNLADLGAYGQWYKTARISDTDGRWSELQPESVAFMWVQEIITIPDPDFPIDKELWRSLVSSEETLNWNMPSENAHDGDITTLWHSQYTPTEALMPHIYSVDLSGIYKLAAIQILPRPGAGNGTIKDYEVYTSMNGNSWKLRASGTFPDSAAKQTITLVAENVKHFRIKILSEQDGGQQAAIAEIYGFGELVVLKPPKPPKNIK